MAVVSIILVSFIQYITSQLKFSFYRAQKEQAFQVAEAGIYYYRWYLAHQVSGKTAQQIKTFWQSGNPYGVGTPYEADYSDPEGGVVGRYKIEVEPPDANSTIVIVKSTGWTIKNPLAKRVVQVRFRRPSWSEYAVLANDFMRFGEGTEIFGKVHSNNGIHFDGLAHNVVSSSVEKYNDPDHEGNDEFGVHTHVSPVDPLPPSPVPSRPDVFQAGRQFALPSVDFNGVISDLNFMKSESKISGHGVYLDNSKCDGVDIYGRHIILKEDGTFDVTKVTSYDSTSKGIEEEGCLANYAIPDNGVIFAENNIWVEGKVNNKKVTLVAANLEGGSIASVYIGINDLLYTNFDGKDVIGLIAQQNISAIMDCKSILTIDAALLAQSGKVGMNYYGENYHKDTLTINGSMATNIRYGFAYTDGSGFTHRNLNFDNNLLYFPPPYFPTGTEYSIDLWEEL